MRIILPEYVIHGDCSLFACRCCRTKYGWTHQAWCENCLLTVPACMDCHYYHCLSGLCTHPALKRIRKEDAPREEDQRPLRTGQNA